MSGKHSSSGCETTACLEFADCQNNCDEEWAAWQAACAWQRKQDVAICKDERNAAAAWPNEFAQSALVARAVCSVIAELIESGEKP